jgi:hypothetical protein
LPVADYLSPNVIDSVGHEGHPSSGSWQTNVIDGRSVPAIEITLAAGRDLAAADIPSRA